MKKHKAFANKIIREMRESGLTYGDMLCVIRLTLEKLENLKKIKK